MGLFNLHDGDAESRDDIVRMEIEEAAEADKHDWWTWLSTPWSDEFREGQVTDWEDFEAYDL